MGQTQFLSVVSLKEARARWSAALDLTPLPAEDVPLADLPGRVLAQTVRAPGDVPAFDRSNVDGVAVRAEDTFGATEAEPLRLALLDAEAAAGRVSDVEVGAGQALPIATGGVVPRGADAVVMVEDTRPADDGGVWIRRPVVPGERISHAGSDLARGDALAWRGTRLDARDTGVFAACGLAAAPCHRRPRVGILSTGDEIVPPGTPLGPGQVHDANATFLAHTIQELGADATLLGIAPDDRKALGALLTDAREAYDLLLLSGGTSKGRGDLTYRALAEQADIVVHGVALKPGKPLCLAAWDGRPVAILPGFPTSAIFTFHLAVAPVLLRLMGRDVRAEAPRSARLLRHVRSERGREELCLVRLTPAAEGPPHAVPLGKGSGSVTTFARANGFFSVGADTEYMDAGTLIDVIPLGRGDAPDVVMVGSHCAGVEILAEHLAADGWRVQVVSGGSQAGLSARRENACDIAPIHLLDADTGTWNTPFVPEGDACVPGYGRTLGIAMRPEEDARLTGEDADALLRACLADPDLRMANRNPGSGTWQVLEAARADAKAQPVGWSSAYRSHTAVAAAIAQGRADWGVCLASAAEGQGLVWRAWRDEQLDFVVAAHARERPGVQAFFAALQVPAVQAALRAAGLHP